MATASGPPTVMATAAREIVRAIGILVGTASARVTAAVDGTAGAERTRQHHRPSARLTSRAAIPASQLLTAAMPTTGVHPSAPCTDPFTALFIPPAVQLTPRPPTRQPIIHSHQQSPPAGPGATAPSRLRPRRVAPRRARARRQCSRSRLRSGRPAQTDAHRPQRPPRWAGWRRPSPRCGWTQPKPRRSGGVAPPPKWPRGITKAVGALVATRGAATPVTAAVAVGRVPPRAARASAAHPLWASARSSRTRSLTLARGVN